MPETNNTETNNKIELYLNGKIFPVGKALTCNARWNQ